MNKEGLIQATLVYPLRDNKVWLARKQKKVAAGLYSGWGGKKEPHHQSITDTAVEELDEENDYGIQYRREDLIPRAVIDFTLNYSEKPSFAMKVFIYVLNGFEGELGDSDEIKDPQSFSLDEVPYDQMLPDNILFLPQVLDLEVEPFIGEIVSQDGKIVQKHLETISKDEIYRIFEEN
ncbi:NUDIX domain-containing protein [Patescibacteria group bacterium]|nr:NUDIX domain-containing protein [Patescibacteria group bacterium]